MPQLQTAEDVAAAAAAAHGGDIDGTYIVTGGSSGIGEETARVLALYGATVVVAARSEQRGQAAVSRINGAGGAGRAVFEMLDLGSFASVDGFVQRWRQRQHKGGGPTLPPLRAIVLNAGLISSTYGRTADGVESNLQVNHLAQHELVTQLLPCDPPNPITLNC